MVKKVKISGYTDGAYDNSYITVFCMLPTLTAGMYGRPFLGYDVAAESEIP